MHSGETGSRGIAESARSYKHCIFQDFDEPICQLVRNIVNVLVTRGHENFHRSPLWSVSSFSVLILGKK